MPVIEFDTGEIAQRVSLVLMETEVREAEPLQRFDGRKLLELRRAAGINRDALAARVGRTAHVVARWESGRITPSLESVLRIASALACPLDELFAAVESGAGR